MMIKIARRAMSLRLFAGPAAAIDTWMGGNVPFDVPENLADGGSVQTLLKGLKAQAFEEELDGGICRIKLLAPVLIGTMDDEAHGFSRAKGLAVGSSHRHSGLGTRVPAH